MNSSFRYFTEIIGLNYSWKYLTDQAPNVEEYLHYSNANKINCPKMNRLPHFFVTHFIRTNVSAFARCVLKFGVQCINVDVKSSQVTSFISRLSGARTRAHSGPMRLRCCYRYTSTYCIALINRAPQTNEILPTTWPPLMNTICIIRYIML